MQGIDVHASCIPVGLNISPAPGEAVAALPDDQQVRRKTRPAPISIRKWMHRHQTMMKANRQFIVRVRPMLDPKSRIIDNLAEVGLDAIVRHAEIALGRAIRSRPSPDAVEHPSMEPAKEGLVHDISFAAERPAIRFQDVVLFEFVEFAPQRDVCRDQSIPFVRRQRCRVVVGFERLRYFSSQRRAGRRNNSSIRWRRCSLDAALPCTA